MAAKMMTTVSGRITSIEEKRVVGKDKTSVIDFSVAVNHFKYNKANGEYEQAGTTFQRMNAWGWTADKIESTLAVGDPVIVHGEVKTDVKYTDKDGEKRTPSSVLTADLIGLDFTMRDITVDRTKKNNNAGSSNNSAKKAKPKNEPEVTDLDDDLGFGDDDMDFGDF